MTLAPRRWLAHAAAHRVVAVLGACVGAGLVWRWSTAPLAALVMLAATGVSVLAAMVDTRCHRLPDVLVGPLALGLLAVSATSAALRAEPAWLGAALSAGAAAGAVLGVGWLVGMGFGDVKFGTALGVLVGWSVGWWSGAVLAALGVVGGAAVAASVWWGICHLGRSGAPRWFPFGPFLAGAAILVLLVVGPPAVGTAASDAFASEAASGAPVATQRRGAGLATGSPCVPDSPVDSGVCSAS